MKRLLDVLLSGFFLIIGGIGILGKRIWASRIVLGSIVVLSLYEVYMAMYMGTWFIGYAVKGDIDIVGFSYIYLLLAGLFFMNWSIARPLVSKEWIEASLK